MQIRKLTIADARAFRDIRAEMCQLHPEAFHQTPEEVRGMSEEQLRDWIYPHDTFPEKFILAAFESERILATVGFRREELAKERHRGLIWSVYVRAEARGKGLSKRLMEQVIEECRTMAGLEMLFLTVALTQTRARTLYTSLGFFTTGLNLHGYKLPDGRDIDLEEMTLWL
jgi:GNAT superfamily N-acetyltransferase